ncbi:hypothetical protein ACFQHV_00780 [Promicromonospora thailandica]|uniref:Uncharacterized protein n=1 Tax=Promicromonospora thailandica TaxID=765201 RepID=A0A9X2JTA2_9MICO|nr:hypothetical protein [Promicromonospora thailandica]MCP2262726.1 hypothetical protein [Promicromonospora thailandica]BFF18050.1 hypothetical protein GCM10025730_15710 [Promicromonospora thailandica]
MQRLVQYTVLTSVTAGGNRARHLDADATRPPDELPTGCRHVTGQEVVPA